jgi:prepilin-type N-terminal cleavage/methylation domain-containing protein
MKQRGFTLIELVMVMIVMAIIAVSVIPAFQNMPRLRTQAAALRLSSDIRYAQMLAIQTQRQSRVLFDAATNSYQIQLQTPGVPGAYFTVVNPGGVPGGFIVRLNQADFEGVTLSAVDINGTNAVIFSRMGAPLDANGTALGNAGTVTLSGTFRVTIDGVTGRITEAAL